MAKYNCMRENVAKFISPRVVCTNITNRVLSWFDRFTAYYYCMNKKFKKTHISTSFVHNQRFRASYQTLNKNVRKLISPRVLCTSVTNRVVSWFDRFTAYFLRYEHKNVRKLISPRVLCASVTNRVLSWFDFFSVITTVWAKMWEKSYLHEFCTKVSQNVFLANLTVFLLLTNVWRKMSQNSYLREFWAQVSQIVFLTDLTILRLITTVWTKMSPNSYLRGFCSQVS